MSEPKSKINTKKNPTYPLGTLLWVKLLNRVWWPGTVVDPITIPKELLEYVKKVEPIACVAQFKEDKKYHIVGLYEEVFLYSCDRKIEFIEKGFSLYKNQMKGLPVIGKFDMNNFKKDVIAMEELIGGDKCIFEHLKEEKEKFKSIVKELFTPTNTKKSKKKEIERKSLPAPKFTKTPNQPKPKPVSKPRTTTQSRVDKTAYTCHAQVGCNYTTNRYDNLKWHMATHKNDTDVVTTKKSSNSSTSNKRKNLKTKSLEVKKQKLQEELLKDWDNDGEDEDEIITSGVQSSSNVAQSSNEEVLETMIDVPSSNEEIVQIKSEVLSSNNVAQSSNAEIILTKTDVVSSSNVVQSSNEEGISTSKVLSSENDTKPIISKDISRNSEAQETSTCSPNKVFDFNENDNNTPVVELRQSKSVYSSTVDDDISETLPNELVLVEKSTENVIDKPHEIQSNEPANEIDNQTKSTELLLEKTDTTLDHINNFENSLSCISSNINNSDANILTEDNNVVIGESELSECGSLNKTANIYKDIKIETNDVVGIPLVENMSTETEDSAIVEENTNHKEIVSNDEEVNQLNGTTIDKNMLIENLCSVGSTSNKINCEDKIIKKEEFPEDIPKDWLEGPEWESARSAVQEANSYSAELKLPTSHKCTLPEFLK
ncbi:uncharacterized protein LOC100167277 isoform X2 [Acyrthosiphon pisum]|uniref:PWWP domain-containing protein n=1 Tax=Acyrthosiphon pisum TaxID=7029 RepID=A0A8R2FCW9_ACYPI|nr:uncharacterized protein LOC100167277 isoform X2 [Acyrthosiphon pisum]|eukprot:XP_008188198.1 PREDICTED: uncharacterized protein LOC100167277 isoform X2 [Acyrthosiphon pisum]